MKKYIIIFLCFFYWSNLFSQTLLKEILLNISFVDKAVAIPNVEAIIPDFFNNKPEKGFIYYDNIYILLNSTNEYLIYGCFHRETLLEMEINELYYGYSKVLLIDKINKRIFQLNYTHQGKPYKKTRFNTLSIDGTYSNFVASITDLSVDLKPLSRLNFTKNLEETYLYTVLENYFYCAGKWYYRKHKIDDITFSNITYSKCIELFSNTLIFQSNEIEENKYMNEDIYFKRLINF